MSGIGSNEESAKDSENQENQRPRDVVHVHVFQGHVNRSKPSKEDMSALVITGSGEVYGTGRNTVIGWEGESPMRMKEDGPDVLEEYVKVEALSGLGLRKIVVGFGFGAALTHDNQMYMWGGGPRMIGTDDIVMVQEYVPGKPCHCGNSEGGKRNRQGGADLLYCPHGQGFKFYSPKSPPPEGVPVKAYVKRSYIAHCLKCGKLCTDVMFANGDRVNSCVPCQLRREVDLDDACNPLKTLPPSILDCEILDIDCGRSFICSLSQNNELSFLGWRNGKKLETLIALDDGAKVQSISCGKKHLAVLSDAGKLYSYGDLDGEFIGWSPLSLEHSITLRKVSTPGPVLKVRCGDQSTICLLTDHTLWFSCRGIAQTLSLQNIFNQIWVFADIARFLSFTDSFYVKGPVPCYMVVNSSLKKDHDLFTIITDVDCNTALLDSIAPADQMESETFPKDELVPVAAPLHPSLIDLYGKSFLSDLTFKLADGEFPAHRSVLFSTSKYFKNVISSETPPTVLDMTTYNPRAYKVLLQYFYQVEPNDLDLDALLDLCAIATSYDEPAIVDDVVAKMKALIKVDNVHELLAKGSLSGNRHLIRECEQFICSPTFRDRVIRAITNDPMKLVKLLQGQIPQIS